MKEGKVGEVNMASPNLIDIRKRRKRHPQDAYARGDYEQQTPPPPPLMYKKPVIFGINIVLGFLLLIAMILSMVSYFAVTARESRIKELHTATNQLNYENIELQNKVDSLKSFYVLDTKVQKIDFLKKPDKVMEVNETANTRVVKDREDFKNIIPVTGY